MDWISFFMGFGVMFFVLCCVFVLLPAQKSTREAQEQQKIDMVKLQKFWELSYKTAIDRNDCLQEIAIELRRIVDKTKGDQYV